MSEPMNSWSSATEIARTIASGTTTAVAVTQAILERVANLNESLNAYTEVTAERALSEAATIDAAHKAGTQPGPLAGVPFAVKNLYDVTGLPTRAGSLINRDRPPAKQDATLLRRLNRAGGVLIGTLNMGEYAYDFTGENAHDGVCRNPHDDTRMTGGSSSGSGAATAAGIAPISLGSDTNGSLRVPASLCGVFSLKPTYGRLSRGGTFPFVDSLDHVGPLARTVIDLAVTYDVLQGHDPADHACAQRAIEPACTQLESGVDGMRIGVLDGWFKEQAGDDALNAVQQVAQALASTATIDKATLPGAEAGRAAAYLITNAESAEFHLERLRSRAADYDPDTRDRFLAGALLPAAWVHRAQRVRRWWLQQAMSAFDTFDLLLAPATPCTAPQSGETILHLGGRELPLRPSLGLLAQPFSCIGLPVVTAPVFSAGSLPIGVQIIAPAWREDLCLRAASVLESQGVSLAHKPPNSPD